MNTYCRGYFLSDLRRFPGWESDDLPDTTVVYLRDDLTVVTNPVTAEQGVLWDAITPQWSEFCRSVLRFEVPEL